MHSSIHLSAMLKAVGIALTASILTACGGSGPIPIAVNNGTLVASSNEHTLYKFDNDVAGSGKSVCNFDSTGKAGCIVNWPPLTAAKDAQAAGEFTIITRDDGTRQWAASGKPLYFWKGDNQPGDQKGENIGNVWHVATSASTAISVVNGVMIGSKTSMTLYTFDKDTAGSGKSVCNNTTTSTCATTWPPLFAKSDDVANGNFTIIIRDDGKLQWAAKGKPLYFYSGDSSIGHQKGDGLGGVWHLAKP